MSYNELNELHKELYEIFSQAEDSKQAFTLLVRHGYLQSVKMVDEKGRSAPLSPTIKGLKMFSFAYAVMKTLRDLGKDIGDEPEFLKETDSDKLVLQGMQLLLDVFDVGKLSDTVLKDQRLLTYYKEDLEKWKKIFYHR